MPRRGASKLTPNMQAAAVRAAIENDGLTFADAQRIYAFDLPQGLEIVRREISGEQPAAEAAGSGPDRPGREITLHSGRRI